MDSALIESAEGFEKWRKLHVDANGHRSYVNAPIDPPDSYPVMVVYHPSYDEKAAPGKEHYLHVEYVYPIYFEQ